MYCIGSRLLLSTDREGEGGEQACTIGCGSAAIRLSTGWQAGFAGARPHPQRCAGSPPARRGVQPRQGSQALSPPAASLATPAPALSAPRALAPGAAVLLPAR